MTGEISAPPADSGEPPEPAGVVNQAYAELIMSVVQAHTIERVDIHNHAADDHHRPVTAATLLGAGQITVALTGYVRPAAREEAVRLLRERHAVLLYGTRGSGRTTTALDVLPAATGRNEVHRVVFDPDDTLDAARLPHEPATGYLLDVSDPGAISDDRIARLVADYASGLRGENSYLVVVARTDLSHAARTDVPAVRIDPPPSGEVFAQHLIGAGVPPALVARLRADQRIIGLPMPDRPVDVAKLAGGLVRENVAGDDRFDTAIQAAIGAFTDWRPQLTSWFNSHEDVGERALKFATAVLHPAPGAAVGAAVRTLAPTRTPPTAGVPAAAEAAPAPLQGPPLSKRAEEIGAELDDNGAVRFVSPSYAPAVRHFVWRNYCEARPALTTWVTSITGGDAARAVDAVIDLVIATGDETLLRAAAESWSETRRRHAVRLLDTLATDRDTGQRVRALLYDWAARSTKEHRMLTVAAVCARYGTVYEQNALTRLRQLARHPQEAVLVETIKALGTLASGGPGRRARIVEEVTRRWIADTDRTRAGTGRYAFAVLARMEERPGVPLLLADLVRRENVNVSPLAVPIADGIRALLLANMSTAEDVINIWVEAAVADTALYRPVLDTLIRCAAGDHTATVRLDYIANRWDDGPEARRTLRHTLIERIERADPLVAGVVEARHVDDRDGDDAA